MTSITWAGPRCVQEAAAILGPQNRTQGRCESYYLITSDGIIQVEGENVGEEGEASDDVHMEEDDDNEAEAGEEQEPDAEEMWNKMSDFPNN